MGAEEDMTMRYAVIESAGRHGSMERVSPHYASDDPHACAAYARRGGVDVVEWDRPADWSMLGWQADALRRWPANATTERR